MSGRALFLVGPSSSGKTTLGHALLATLPEPWLFYESDFTATFHSPADRFDLATVEMKLRMTYGTALALRGYLDAGFDLIIERSLWWPEIRQRCARVFDEYRAYLVGLKWDLTTLGEREHKRTDGIFAGTARQQVLGWGSDAWDLPYDLVVDVDNGDAISCAAEVSAWITSDPRPHGIAQLAARPGSA